MLAPVILQQYLVPKPVGLVGTAAISMGRLGDYATALGISNDLVGNITNAFKDALDNEVYAVLNAEDVTNTFLINLPIFTGRVINLMIRSTQDVVRGISLSKISINDFNRAELAISRELARLIRSTNYPHAEDLVYALSMLIEYDLWVVNNVVRYGFNEVISRINERALNEAGEASAYLMATAFAWYSSTSAVLGMVREYREGNRDLLARWSREYADELDAYIDTLDLLINDETYEALVEEGVIKQ